MSVGALQFSDPRIGGKLVLTSLIGTLLVVALAAANWLGASRRSASPSDPEAVRTN